MKISNSKKQLAKIIHENGGWKDQKAEWSAQDGSGGQVSFFKIKAPTYSKPEKEWMAFGGSVHCYHSRIEGCKVIKNFHQTILSREEYFHLYHVAEAAPDADGWIEFDGTERPSGHFNKMIDVKLQDGREITDSSGRFEWDTDGPSRIIAYRPHKPEQAKPESDKVEEAKPTIEQLAADYRNAKDYANRKQQEADAKLAELVAAGKALGLVLSVAAPELVLSVAGVQNYTGKFYNAELGEAPAYGKYTSDAVCDGCGKRYGEHYGDRCKSGGER